MSLATLPTSDRLPLDHCLMGRLFGTLFTGVVLLNLSGCSSSGLSIVAVSPTTGPMAGGTIVAIQGVEFSSGLQISVGGVGCTSVSGSSTQVTCTTGAHPEGSADVIVTNSDGKSASLPNGYFYKSDSALASAPSVPPTLSGISVAKGSISGGTLVTVTGTGFLSGITVKFGGVSCSAPNLLSGTQVSCATPKNFIPGLSNVDVINLDGGSASLAGAFTYESASMINPGDEANCVIVNGGLQCTGNNLNGALGNGTLTSSNVPTQVLGLTSGVQMASAGLDATCALINGEVKCWGKNGGYGLGNGTNTQAQSTPSTPTGLPRGATSIVVGVTTTCAVVDGAAWCWGANEWGEAGDGTGNVIPVPKKVIASGVQSICVGKVHSCAILNGSAKCWGSNGNGTLGDGTTTAHLVPAQVTGLTSGVQEIMCGTFATCALVNGGVKCWGRNNLNVLGNSAVPQGVVVAGPTSFVSGLSSGVQSLSLGSNTGCALVDGAARCWGANSYGQLGNASKTTSDTVATPVNVSGLDSGVQQLRLSGSYGCALVNGSVKCWGSAITGATTSGNTLGAGSTTFSKTPIQMIGLSGGITMIAQGSYHACALVNGGVLCWGRNENGQLGDGSTLQRIRPVQVSGLTSGVQAIAAGSYHTCALVNGRVKCWGKNDAGQLGDNTTTDRLIPVDSSLLNGVRTLVSGANHTCALLNAGVKCWGKNDLGQIGDNSTTNRLIATDAVGLTSGVSTVAAGASHTCAVQDGSMKCWGANAFGQLGDSTTSNRSAPVQVGSLTQDVLKISAGADHSCAIVNGAAKCWGKNANGQIGNNTQTNSQTPVSVSGLTSGVQAIASGASHTCAIVNGGGHCWGSNSSGQLGNGSSSANPSLVPVDMATWGTGGVQSLAIGPESDSSCAILDGVVKCWGNNTYGQVGNDTTTAAEAAVTVAF